MRRRKTVHTWRPISLTSVLSRLADKMYCERLRFVIEKHSLLKLCESYLRIVYLLLGIKKEGRFDILSNISTANNSAFNESVMANRQCEIDLIDP
jgi:hypothetical protein